MPARYLHGDAREPGSILAAPKTGDVLDLSRPLALSVIGLLHFLDDDVATRLIRTVLDAAPSGSYLALTNITRELDPETIDNAAAGYAGGGVRTYLRDKREIQDLFLGGLDIVDPGVVVVHRWRPDATPTIPDVPDVPDVPDISVYGAVARKP
jgi:hypothetical protein